MVVVLIIFSVVVIVALLVLGCMAIRIAKDFQNEK